MEEKRPSIFPIIIRYIFAFNFILMALVYYRNIGGSDLSGITTQIGALAIFSTFIAGSVYLFTGKTALFSNDGMDVIVVCLFTLGVGIWTLVRGVNFLIEALPMGISKNLDFKTLVDFYQTPGSLLSIWTSWFIFKTAFGIQLRKK